MIHAVLFNPSAFDKEGLEEIIRRTGGHYEGAITTSVYNCLESFPDGSLYKSFTSPDADSDGLVNCHNDTELFIRVNLKGESEDDRDSEPGYDDYVMQLQDGDITYREFIREQEDIEEEYEEWKQQNHIEDSEESAKHFLRYRDNFCMITQSLV